MNYDNMLQLRNRLSHINAGRLLDVASGKGDFLDFSIHSFKSYICAAGIDINPGLIETASERFNLYPVIMLSGSALKMPFADKSFDTVAISNSLHHIENTSQLFKEIIRVSRKGALE